jgi:capsular polysaccharide biosynthesis protein
MGDAIGTTTPSFPNWPQIIGLSFAFGLVLGIVLAVLTELMARRVRGAEDLGFASKAPVLAIIADAPPSVWRERLKSLFKRKGGSDALQPAE